MEKIGTVYGGWIIPSNIDINENSIIYSAGVGEDISFDLILNNKYKSNIVLIDPTEKAKKHFSECIEYYKNKSLFTGNIQTDYYEKISNLQPNLDKFLYLEIGLWDKSDKLKFFKQENKNYVSQTLIDGMFGNEYDIVNVDTVKNIMEQLRHDKIDLFKLDIEGAEIKVLQKMFDDGIFPSYICVEFDLLSKNKDYNGETQNLIDKLKNIYKYNLIAIDDFNYTFQKTI